MSKTFLDALSATYGEDPESFYASENPLGEFRKCVRTIAFDALGWRKESQLEKLLLSLDTAVRRQEHEIDDLDPIRVRGRDLIDW